MARGPGPPHGWAEHRGLAATRRGGRVSSTCQERPEHEQQLV